MKVLSLILPLLATTVSAGVPKPDVTIGLNVGDGDAGGLGGIEPKIKWSSGVKSINGFDVEGGVDVTVTDVDKKPDTSFWGVVKKFVPGIGDVSIRADMDADAPETVDFDVRTNTFGTSLVLKGQADMKSNSVALSDVQVTKDLDVPGGTLTVTPKYDIGSSSGDVRVGYALDNTSFVVDAQKKKLTVAHSFPNNDKVVPSFTADGDFSISYSRDLDRGRLTTTYSPDDSVKVQWNDGEWQTTFTAPLDGLYQLSDGVKITMNRKVDMF